MQIEEFVALVESEPERVVSQNVQKLSHELSARAAKPTGLPFADLLSAPARGAEQRDTRYRHVLGPPASSGVIDALLENLTPLRLPADLCDLVKRVNGIHLWANVETGRAYTGLAPVEEWELASVRFAGERDARNDRSIAITYHQDGAAFVVLDLESAEYFLMDTAGPDRTSPIARNVPELLEWLWRTRIAPQPS